MRRAIDGNAMGKKRDGYLAAASATLHLRDAASDDSHRLHLALRNIQDEAVSGAELYWLVPQIRCRSRVQHARFVPAYLSRGREAGSPSRPAGRLRTGLHTLLGGKQISVALSPAAKAQGYTTGFRGEARKFADSTIHLWLQSAIFGGDDLLSSYFESSAISPSALATRRISATIPVPAESRAFKWW
jgi:hypothetical protein